MAPFVPNGSRDLLPIGDYTVKFLDSDGNGIKASFADSGGPLEVSGTLIVDARRAYTLDGWNRYAFARNNPLRYVDPTGMLRSATPRRGRRLTLTGSL